MNKSKIFIASSDKTRIFAEMLRDELNNEQYCDARTWRDAQHIGGARAKIEMLEEWIHEYDFAVIVFSKADMLGTELADENLKTRDDCVFEAGLFMAAIGRNRCFLVSGVEKNELPSDLGGIHFLQFNEPSNLQDREECGLTSQPVASVIKTCVQKDMARGLANRPLSQDALLKRQQMESEGGELREDQVVVAALQPLELGLGYEAAKQVWLNLDKNISYVYLFQGSIDAADKVPQLLQLLLLSGLLDKEDAASFSKRGELVTSHREEILDSLRDICTHDKLNVFFLKESGDLEYCIHNAADYDAARLYLKHGDVFIEWESGPQAHSFWCAMREKNGADDPQPPNALFHGAHDFELKEGPFLRHLKIGMNKYFRDIAEEVMELCLEGPR